MQALESEVARTAHLVLSAQALVDRMKDAPRSGTLPENLARLERAVDRGRAHLAGLVALEG